MTPLDPATAQLLEVWHSLGLPKYEELGPDGAREQFRWVVERRRRGTEPLPVGDVRFVDVDGLRLKVLTPVGEGPWPLVVHFHGGGWVVGDVDSYDWAQRRLVDALGAVVVSVDYRLAPESPWPGPVEDAWKGLQWAVSGALPPTLVDGRPPLLTGDSAGGQLAAVCALRARDAGQPLAGQLLVYPSVSLVRSWPSYEENGHGYLLERSTMGWFTDQYVPDRSSRRHPEASPLEAPSLAGVAPAVVVVASHDPLRDEGVAYADRLRSEGVPVTLVVGEGLVHGFEAHTGISPKADEVLREAHAAARLLLRG